MSEYATKIINTNDSSSPYGYSIGKITPLDLNLASLKKIEGQFKETRSNLEAFQDSLRRGDLLNQMLRSTSGVSYQGTVLSNMARDSSFRNMMSGCLNGHHISQHSVFSNLGDISVFLDYISRTPIPENLEAVSDASFSLVALKELAENHNEIYLRGKQSYLTPEINGGIIKFATGLEARITTGDKLAIPFFAEENENLKMPKDRIGLASYSFPEKTRIKLQITNKSDKTYALVPTINGIPFKVEAAKFLYSGFETSDFPLVQVTPIKSYLHPGEELKCNTFHVNKSSIVKNLQLGLESLSVDNILELSHLFGKRFYSELSTEDRDLLNKLDLDVRNKLKLDSTAHYVKNFLKQLDNAKETEIILRKPSMRKVTESSGLENSMLGSLGIAVVEVSKPPVDPIRNFSINSQLPFIMSSAKGGIGGLAHVGGGVETLAKKIGGDWNHNSDNHTFVGFIPINLFSQVEKMRVIK